MEIFNEGDWVLTRSYCQGATLGKLACGWDGGSALMFTEAYHVKSFEVSDKAGGTIATLGWQEPKNAEVYGGNAGCLNEDVLAWLLTDAQAESILKFKDRK